VKKLFPFLVLIFSIHVDATASPFKLDEIILTCKQGNASDCFNVGLMYDLGDGVVQDKNEAFKWYAKAAKQGNANAQHNLGVKYDKGEGVAQDKKEALKWYTESSDQGHASSQFNLGVIYLKGENGVQQNRDKAIELFKKSAQQNNKNAIGALKILGF